MKQQGSFLTSYHRTSPVLHVELKNKIPAPNGINLRPSILYALSVA